VLTWIINSFGFDKLVTYGKVLSGFVPSSRQGTSQYSLLFLDEHWYWISLWMCVYTKNFQPKHEPNWC